MATTIHGLEKQSPVADQLRRQWVRACLIGEFWGFAPPALTGATLVALGASDVTLIVGLTLAGIVEGVVLGRFQAAVLKEWIPTVGDWTLITAVSAGVAWFVGMAGSQLIQSIGAVGLVLAVPGWVVGLCAMGLFQARELRMAVGRSAAWFPICTLAWSIGVTIPVLGLSIIPNGWPLAVHVVVAIAAAVAMGATVGAITARPLVTLVPTDAHRLQPTLATTEEPQQ